MQACFVLNFDRSSIKHVLQNTQNDCHQWPSDSSRVHQICFRPGLPWTGPRWGSLQRSPRPLPSWFKGSLLLSGGKGREGKGIRGEGARERDGEGKKGKERVSEGRERGRGTGREGRRRKGRGGREGNGTNIPSMNYCIRP